MQLTVLETAQVILPEDISAYHTVVIDVLRATSCMVTALGGGAKEIIPCLTQDDALSTAANFPLQSRLLGGERKCLPLPGFDLGNSPLEYTPEKVTGKHIITTTTNGTAAIHRLAQAQVKSISISAFLNSKSVAHALRKAPHLLILCAGTKGRFSLDDFTAAGRIVSLLEDAGPLDLNDAAMAARDLYRLHADSLPQLLLSTHHGQILAQNGMGKDIYYCTQLDIFDLVPVWNGTSLSL